MSDKQNIKKVCSFCVSDLHLVTMLLPYLDKKIKENEKFITISENNLEEQIKLVLSRLTLNSESKNNLANINWNTKNLYNYEAMSKEIKKVCKSNNNLSIIVNGSKEYIEVVNGNLNKFFENSKIQNSIKIINCYDITTLDDDIKFILKTHDIILNTSGEKDISEVFVGYEKRKYA